MKTEILMKLVTNQKRVTMATGEWYHSRLSLGRSLHEGKVYI